MSTGRPLPPAWRRAHEPPRGRRTAHSRHHCGSTETEKPPGEQRGSLQRSGLGARDTARLEGRPDTNFTPPQTRSTVGQARFAREGHRRRCRRRLLLPLQPPHCLPYPLFLALQHAAGGLQLFCTLSSAGRWGRAECGLAACRAWAAAGLAGKVLRLQVGREQLPCNTCCRHAAQLHPPQLPIMPASLARSAWPQRFRCWPSTAPRRCCSAGWMQSIPGNPTK